MLWRNPKWLRAELIWNNDYKTTGKGVKPPLTTALMNSQKLLAEGKCICTVWQMEITWARLPSGNFLLCQSRESERTSWTCLWGGRTQKGAQAQAQPFTPSLRVDLFFPGVRETVEVWTVIFSQFFSSSYGSKLDKKFHHVGHDKLHNSLYCQDWRRSFLLHACHTLSTSVNILNIYVIRSLICLDLYQDH